ncbi:uncharacterized protein Pyn_17770 [Prunus yedoensis var. nudiflora]|uniref:Uncharacterized protein n=1 Tax=Prunus yedoensis var. nudiflora TaxID=2094558 RepID=A0A314YCC1_PRUYE|nr:uncharacterized protein Pyn_17770 [Prunus yedoensis var. nudiflora]
MISILAQERLLGAALGSIFTGIIREPIFGSKSRAEFAHLWNKAVDQTFRPVIESLSSSGW